VVNLSWVILMSWVHDRRPSWARRGFNRQIYWSVTCEINWQIAQLRKRGLEPVLVRLGSAASAVYAREHRAQRVSQAPTHHDGYRCRVPIRYRDPRLSGVAVEGRVR
jgi:hypothetical protein